MRRGVIFDLDGTLVNTPDAIVMMMKNAIRALGVVGPGDHAIRSMVGLPLEAGAAKILDRQEDHPEVLELIKLYRDQFLKLMVPRAKDLLFDGVRESLELLVSEGFALGVATSKYQRSAEAVLQSAEIRGFFDFVAGSDCITHQKPDPEMALLVADRLGCSPSSCTVVGDTIHDMRMGKAAGMVIIGVSYGVGTIAELRSATPAAIIGDLGELAPALRTINLHESI